MAITSYTGVLHTNSEKYYSTGLKSFSSKNENLRAAEIEALRAKEASFYSSIFPGVSSIEDFIFQLRKLFNDIQADKEVLQKFQRDNLLPYLKSFSKSNYFSSTGAEDLFLTFRVEEENAELDLSTIFSSLQEEVSFSQGEYKIALGMDQNTIKKTMNQLLGDNAKTQAQIAKLFKAQRKKVKNNSGEYTYYNFWPELSRLFTEKLSMSPGLLQVAPSLTSRFYYENSKHIKNPLYGGTAADAYYAKDNPNSNVAQELESIRQKLKTQIWRYAGLDSGLVSQEMRDSFNSIWAKTMEGDITSAAFFEKGGTFTYLTGAFGEFQTSLMYEYINRKLGKIPGTFSAEISNTLKSSQDKVDVNLKNTLESFGVQVKNYGASSYKSSFNINSTPQEITQYSSFSKLGGESSNFLTFVANYYFNETYQSAHQDGYAEVLEVLPIIFAEIANLGTEDLNDKVSFYQIGGNYFVPASAILASYYDNSLSTGSFSMTGPKPKGSDNYFRLEKCSYDNTLPAGADYFIFRGNDYFVANSENASTFNRLISHDISLRGSFDYKTIPNLSSYSLF